MGINASKWASKVQENNTGEQAKKDHENTNVEEEGSIPSTPILTPKNLEENAQQDNLLDPRSPSKHIARTPIELLTTATEKLQSLTIENNHNGAPTETPLKKHILLGIDPRSPSLEIQRTPILINASPNTKLPEKIRNKNLDKVLKCALPSTPKDKVVPPKLLQSCPVTPKVPKPKLDAYKRKSFVLLETNVDYTETDLDNVIKEKYLGKSLQDLCTQREELYNEISDPRSPTVDFLRTPIQVAKNVDDSNKEAIEEPVIQNESETGSTNNLNETECEEVSVDIDKLLPVDAQPEKTVLASNEQDTIANAATAEITCKDITELEIKKCNEPTEEIDQDQIPISLTVYEPVLDICEIETTEPISVTPCKKQSTSTKKHKLVISPITKKRQFPQLEAPVTKSAPITPPCIVSVTPKKTKSQPVTPPLIDLTADIQELDKKLTHLIYEDKDLVVCPRVVKIKDQNRTPLGLRNGTDNKKPATQKLKVSDKPRKADYAVSKIPVFKEKKIKVQCENTPPRSMRGTTYKKSQWDAKDDTLVI